MRVAIDTNILAYAVGFSRDLPNEPRIALAQDLLERLDARSEIVVATQTLGELYNLGIRAKFDRSAVRSVIVALSAQYSVTANNAELFAVSVDLATDHRLQIWDSLILATAAGAGCVILLSEDMQNGFAWRGVTVINPFAVKPHPLLASVLT